MCLSKATDLDLVTDLKAGRPEALTEIFRRHWRALYLTAFHKLRSHELAEEVVQELFTELWDKRERLFSHPLSVNLLSYLNRAVKNKILNHLRKKIYDQRYWEYCKQYIPASENSAHQLAEYNELEEKLNSAMGELSVPSEAPTAPESNRRLVVLGAATVVAWRVLAPADGVPAYDRGDGPARRSRPPPPLPSFPAPLRGPPHASPGE